MSYEQDFLNLEKPPWFQPLLKRISNPSQDILSYFKSIVATEDIVRIPALKPNYIVNDPEAIHHILLTNRENYTKAGTSYERIEHVVGKGLLTTSGEEWATRRQHYQPLFHGKHLINYVDTIYKYTEQLLATWESNPGKVNMTEDMLSLVMNISAESFLGLDVSADSLELVRMIHIMNQYAVSSITLWKWLPTVRNLRYQYAKNYLDRFILSSLETKSIIQAPLLSELLQRTNDGQLKYSKEYILGEVKNFFVAGHETTGNALSWILYCLAKNSYVLIQVVAEIKEVLGSSQPDFKNIEELSYIEMVIQEALRLYPPIWIFTRKAIAEDTLGSYKIPAGGIINIVPYLIHRHPKYWNQPAIFYPERFSPDENKGRPKCAYIPFGFGPRVCIGRQFALLNIKIILIMILQRFEIKLPSKDYKVTPLPLITLKPQKNLQLKVSKAMQE